MMTSDYVFCPYCSGKLAEVITEGITRKICASRSHRKAWTHYPSVGQASVGIIVRGDMVLLVRRNREPYKNMWGLPAGFVEFGEHPLDALKREVEQETKLVVVKSKFLKFIQSDEDPRSPGQLVFFYWVTATKGKIKNNDPDENLEIGWFKITEPPEIGWPSHRSVMTWLQEKNKKRRQV